MGLKKVIADAISGWVAKRPEVEKALTDDHQVAQVCIHGGSLSQDG